MFLLLKSSDAVAHDPTLRHLPQRVAQVPAGVRRGALDFSQYDREGGGRACRPNTLLDDARLLPTRLPNLAGGLRASNPISRRLRPPLLSGTGGDVEDIIALHPRPDDKSVLVYVMRLYSKLTAAPK